MKFSYFRTILGIYLTWHFSGLINHAEELFGDYMPFDYKLVPTYDFFPNILNHINATYFVVFLAFVSAFFALARGTYRRVSALILWYGWACLVNRNPLISNPGIPYVGWLLLASACIRNDRIPPRIFWLAWFLMGLGYTISGIHKLQCQSWIDGSALEHVLNSPLARNNLLRDMLMSMPKPFLMVSTWLSLVLEILFLPLGMFYNTRFAFWILYMVFQLAIVTVVNFTDLTLGVLMIHVFTFDMEWIKQKKN